VRLLEGVSVWFRMCCAWKGNGGEGCVSWGGLKRARNVELKYLEAEKSVCVRRMKGVVRPHAHPTSRNPRSQRHTLTLSAVGTAPGVVDGDCVIVSCILWSYCASDTVGYVVVRSRDSNEVVLVVLEKLDLRMM
jgi:hypothetical protein